MILSQIVKSLSIQNSRLAIRNFSSTHPAAMRFVQYKNKSDDVIKVGVLSEDGKNLTEIPGVSNMVNFLKSGVQIADVKQKISSSKPFSMSDDYILLPPVSDPQKIVCIGLNYSGHCLEQNKAPPTSSMYFSKYASSLVGPRDNVVAHKITNKLDWEVELAVIIGKEAKHVSKENAFDYVFGYSVSQDISARDWQKDKNGGQFLIGKSMDTFCPLGPSIVHKSLVADPHNLIIKCSINGVEKQRGNTEELIFKIDDIISELTQSITLLPGDVILTGTPAGVGMHRNPPEFLKPGDVIESEIESLGKIINKVVAP